MSARRQVEGAAYTACAVTGSAAVYAAVHGDVGWAVGFALLAVVTFVLGSIER